MKPSREELAEAFQRLIPYGSHFILIVVAKNGVSNGGGDATMTTLTSIHDKQIVRDFLEEALRRVNEP